jgi:hypothetical protein
MSALKTKIILFNAAAALVAVSAMIAVGRSILAPSTTPPCSERYTTSTAFQLERGGTVVSSVDLQAQLGGYDSGLVENVEVVKPRDARVPVAMRVKLRHAAPSTGSGVTGMSFPWTPRAVQNETAACLSYNVFLAKGLDFQSGGTLPGIRGQDRSQQSSDGFAASLMWHSNGQPAVALSVTNKGDMQRLRVDQSTLALPRERWFKIQEEVVLNAPGRSDGVLRMWLDGALAIERTNIAYRAKPDVTIAGVAAAIHYGREGAAVHAPADTQIWVSPFEISWR